MGSVAAWAETALMYVTPQNIKDGTFRLTSKASRNHTVDFVIRRDVRKLAQPSRSGYLSIGTNSIGTPVKLEQDGKVQTFRFSVPEEKVADSVFTLWGSGRPSFGEEVTYQFKLADFRKPR
jgi:hypothetical protein